MSTDVGFRVHCNFIASISCFSLGLSVVKEPHHRMTPIVINSIYKHILSVCVCLTGGEESWRCRCPEAGGLPVGQEPGRRGGRQAAQQVRPPGTRHRVRLK